MHPHRDPKEEMIGALLMGAGMFLAMLFICYYLARPFWFGLAFGLFLFFFLAQHRH